MLVISMIFYFVCLVTIKDYKLPGQDSVSKGHSFSDLFILNNENDVCIQNDDIGFDLQLGLHSQEDRNQVLKYYSKSNILLFYIVCRDY